MEVGCSYQCVVEAQTDDEASLCQDVGGKELGELATKVETMNIHFSARDLQSCLRQKWLDRLKMPSRVTIIFRFF